MAKDKRLPWEGNIGMSNRVRAYQYMQQEVLYDFSSSAGQSINSESGLYGRNNEYSERYKALNDQAIQIIINIAKSCCTPKQLTVFELTLAGKTQQEIATISGLNQSSITKCLNGNETELANGERIRYGGIFKKVRIKLLESTELRIILKTMLEIK